MAINEIFEAYCQSKTNLIAVDPDDLSHNRVLEWLVPRFDAHVAMLAKTHHKMPPVVFGFVASDLLGAKVDMFEGSAIIAVNASVPTMIANMLTSVRSQIGAFPSLTQPIVVLSGNGLWTTEADVLTYLFNGGQLYTHQDVAPDDVLVLALSLCSFVFFHEFIHIRNGHFALHNTTFKKLAMEEINPGTSVDLTVLDRQTMEWDADKVAYIVSTDLALTTLLGQPYPERSPRDVFLAFREYHIGLYLLFRLMQRAESKTKNVREHPAPEGRMSLILEASQSMADLLKVGALPAGFAVDVMRTGEVAWAAITGQVVAGITYQADLIGSQIDHLGDVLQNWNQLRERLAPHNLGELPLARPFPPDPAAQLSDNDA